MGWRFAAVAAVVLLLAACSTPPVRGDAHVHLSYRGPSALDALADHDVSVVRDCGGDAAQLRGWREEIARGERRGPRIFFSGRVIDGPKPMALFRITVRTPDEARAAVATLDAEGVDFVKTHNALSREAFFAVLDEANRRGLRVASHLPAGVSVVEAAEAGVGSIEHAAESLLSSAITTGAAADVDAAMAWWESPAGDAAIDALVQHGVAVVPTLVAYEQFTEARRGTPQYEPRRRVLAFLVRLVGRLHRRGVVVMAGSDTAGPDAPIEPGASLEREIELLREAGLDAKALRAAAGPNLVAWLGAARVRRAELAPLRPPIEAR
jgi:imidazolonepropionase-like amidohydrolase